MKRQNISENHDTKEGYHIFTEGEKVLTVNYNIHSFVYSIILFTGLHHHQKNKDQRR